MIKIVFSFIIIIHGLIHTLGFVKAFQPAKLEEFTQNITKSVGILWLITAFLFISTAIIFLLKYDWWWTVAIFAIILSQGLIITQWQDAKYGTIANIIIFIGIVIGYGIWNFNFSIKNNLKTFYTFSNNNEKIITEKSVENLPPIIQKWMKYSRVIGKKPIQNVYLEQKGRMKLTPKGKWMTVEAKQWFKTEKPKFIWMANVKALPGIYFAGRDKYENGKGHMLIKLFYILPIVNEKGKEIDQGTALRYLGEIVWFPSAALNNYITWEQLNPTTAKATIIYGNFSASGIFKFNEDGKVLSFQAKRYYSHGGKITLEDWVVQIEQNSYKEFEGIKIPSAFNVIWKLKEGDFTWYKFEITNIKYNLQPIRK